MINVVNFNSVEKYSTTCLSTYTYTYVHLYKIDRIPSSTSTGILILQNVKTISIFLEIE